MMDKLHHFDDRMGTNPLGDRIGIKAIDEYVLECYRNPIFTQQRLENGKTERGNINVFEYKDEKYVKLGTLWFNDCRDAKKVFSQTTDKDKVNKIVDDAE